MLRERLNDQFKLGARNQAFLIEYVGGMETVKSLQMEPQINNRYGDYLSSYLAANFKTQRLSNSYNVSANTLEQIHAFGVGVKLKLKSNLTQRKLFNLTPTPSSPI